MRTLEALVVGGVLGASAALSSCDGCSGSPAGPCDSGDPPAGCGEDCRSGTPCPAGLYCNEDGRCTADCVTNDECGAGERCNENGICVATSTGDGGPVGGCSTSEDCPGDQVCHPYSQTCVEAGGPCESHEDCPAGTYCEESLGACLPGTTGSPCASDDNCDGTCTGGVCGCDGLAHEQELSSGPLDVYLVLDRTGSMGRDCDYRHGDDPPSSSKACYATYALCDYLIDVTPEVDTRLAFHFMSQEDDCDGTPYETPLVDLTPLPVTEDDPVVRAIDAETFGGGLGTHIEGALRGLAAFTAAHRTEGREMIGVLMTDGDPNGCEERISTLRGIIADHVAATGIRTFIIGMEGATDDNLEELGGAGGADAHDDWCGSVRAPCHFWNVGDGSGDAIASALQAIVRMAVPLPCDFSVTELTPPEGEELDYGEVNVTLTEGGVTTTIGQVPNAAACPTDRPAWYYDAPGAPTRILLCPTACTMVSEASDGSRLDVVVGCRETVVLI